MPIYQTIHRSLNTTPGHTSQNIEALDLATPQSQKAQKMLDQARQVQRSRSMSCSSAETTRPNTVFNRPEVISKIHPALSDDRDSPKHSGFLQGLKQVAWYLLTGEVKTSDRKEYQELSDKIDQLSREVKTQQELINALLQFLAQARYPDTVPTPEPKAAAGTATQRTSTADSPSGPGMDKFDREHRAYCQRVVNGTHALRKMQLSSDELVTTDPNGLCTLKNTGELQTQQQQKYAALSLDEQKALKDALADPRSREAMYKVRKPYADEEHFLDDAEQSKIHVNAALKSGLNKLVQADNTHRIKPRPVDQSTQTSTPKAEMVTQATQTTPSSSGSTGTDPSA